MPVIERSAAILEPCSLQKTLTTVRTARQLHAAFWRHGAAELELLSAGQMLPGDLLSTTSDAGPGRPDGPMMASILPFDFLYPQSSAGLRRRLYSSPITGVWEQSERLRRPYASGRLDARAYTNHTTESDPIEVYEEAQTGDSEASRDTQSRKPKAKKSVTQPETKSNTDQEPAEYYPIIAHDQAILGKSPYRVDKRHVERALAEENRTGVLPGAFEQDLRSTNYGAISRPAKHGTEADMKASLDNLDNLWNLFQEFSRKKQRRCARPLLRNLSMSERLADHWRITQIFPLIRSELFQESTVDDYRVAAEVRAVIRAYYALGDTETGMEIYKSWIGKPVGFGYPAAEIIKAADWPQLGVLWQDYRNNKYHHQRRQFLKPLDDYGLNGQERGCPDLELEQTEVQHICAIPGFKDKVLQLFDHVFDKSTPEFERYQLMSFLIQATRWVLPQLKSRDACRMVLRLENMTLGQEFIRLCVQRRQLALATKTYLEIRSLPGRGIIAPVLKLLISDIFLPQEDVQKMELVMQDWLKRYPRLDTQVFKAFLSLYAARGDAVSFKRIYDMFAREFPEQEHHAVSDMLLLYTRRGDTAMVQQTFDEIESRYKLKPRIGHWNMLLSAYKRDHNRALEVFADLCDAVEPDEKSFGIIIRIVGRRGELQFVQELHQIALDRGIKMTPGSRVGLIDALCLHDRLDVAEQICKEDSLQAKSSETRSDVRLLWNRLIRHYAVRRDLVSCHRILNEMGDMNVGYDADTYYFLLMGLSYTRQVHHGLHLIRAAQVDGFFKPTAKHFLLLMAGFLKNGELHMVAKVDELLTNAGLPKSSSTTLRNIMALMEAEKKGFKSPDGEVLSTDNFRQALRTFADFLRERQSATQEHEPNIYSEDLGRLPTDLFAALIFSAVIIRKDKSAANKLLQIFRIQEGGKRETSQFSDVRMLVSVLNFEAFQRDFDDVMAIWETIFEMAREAGRSAAADISAADNASSPRRASGLIVPAWKFVLSDSLKTMQRLIEARGDASALKTLFQRVRAAGFELTGPNWNHYIQGLARLGEWREAFTLCERVLMPQWNGWAITEGPTKSVKNRLPLEVRRMGTRLDYRRPISYTIIELARHYGDLINLGPWSREADEVLTSIREECPALIRAISNYPGSINPAQAKILDGTIFAWRQAEWKKKQDDFNAQKPSGPDPEASAVVDSLLPKETAEDDTSAGPLDATASANEPDAEPEPEPLVRSQDDINLSREDSVGPTGSG